MKLRRSHLAGVVLTALVFAALPLLAPQSVAGDGGRDAKPLLLFGQTLVLSDFDNDGSVDRARIASEGSRKSISIQPGISGPVSWLHFETSSNTQGSLFSEDVDDDGDADLVWTDLFHGDSVVVWLGDGTGRFERAGSRQYAKNFTVGGFRLTESSQDSREQASDDETNSQVTLEPDGRSVQVRAPAIIIIPRSQTVLPTGATRRQPSRGPPSLLA